MKNILLADKKISTRRHRPNSAWLGQLGWQEHKNVEPQKAQIYSEVSQGGKASGREQRRRRDNRGKVSKNKEASRE